MNKLLLALSLVFFSCLSALTNAQTNQTLTSGSTTVAVNFPGVGCTYNWVNNTPGIGLPASGTGDIPSFTAVNIGSVPVTATITATPSAGGFAYITNPNNGTISVINTLTKNVVSVISYNGWGPWGIAVSPDGSRVYVSDPNNNFVYGINSTTNAQVTAYHLIDAPRGIAVSPDGSRIYVTDEFTNNVVVVNTLTNVTLTTIPVGTSPLGVAVSPDGSRVYVANQGSQTVSVINTLTNSVVSTIPLGMQPNGIVVSPDGSRVYVSANLPGNAIIINAATNAISKVIPIGQNPIGITMAPDGSKVYIVNEDSGTISVIDTRTQSVVGTIGLAGSSSPFSISITPDGSQIYVVSQNGKVFVVNTSTYAITDVISVALGPLSFGNFISAGTGCNSAPITFTITVNPVAPAITASSVTGTISACVGSVSSNPILQQFTISGKALTNNITATAPPGFEVSLSADNGYGNSVILAQTGGTVNNTVVYVRSSAAAPAGNISGNVVLTSSGAATQNVAVTGTINALPTVDQVANQKLVSGAFTTAVHFTGTANTFNWVANSPVDIGLQPGGGDIASFKAVNTGSNPEIVTITVTPYNSATKCIGTPITFTIEVDPLLPAVITSAGTLSALSATYGTVSAATSFTISGANMTTGISVTPPPGFELSTDNISFSPTLTIGAAGTISSTLVYVRLTSTTPVGSYSGDIVLSSAGAISDNVPIANSAVTPAPLTISANNVTKTYGQALSSGKSSAGFTVTGLKNNETVGNITISYGTGASGTDGVGTYAGSVTPSAAAGGSFLASNYTITYEPADIMVEKATLTITADNKTKVYGAPNPDLTATYTGLVNNESPSQLTAMPELSTTATLTSLAGTYPIMVTGGASPNYNIIPISGVLTIISSITIPNAFTPNGDGINDLWDIQALSAYPQCIVSIFNRYGNLVFQSRGYPKPWDGTYKNTALPTGTYYYMINLQDGSEPLAGPVTIIR
jgi:gliding motility-associated-like protein